MVKGRRHLIYQNVRKTQLNWVLDCTKAKTTKMDENVKKVESYIYILYKLSMIISKPTKM